MKQYVRRFSITTSNSNCPPAVPLTAEWTHPCTFTQHGRSLSSAALLQLPQVLMPARAPRVNGQTRPSWARSAQTRTKPISLKLWWWTTQESDFLWVQLHFDLKPVPLHLLYEVTGASLWSFALWEEYLHYTFLCLLQFNCSSLHLCLVFSTFQDVKASECLFMQRNWLEVRPHHVSHLILNLISFHLVWTLVMQNGCKFMNVIPILSSCPD